jgi:hypothetical protein
VAGAALLGLGLADTEAEWEQTSSHTTRMVEEGEPDRIDYWLGAPPSQFTEDQRREQLGFGDYTPPSKIRNPR